MHTETPQHYPSTSIELAVQGACRVLARSGSRAGKHIKQLFHRSSTAAAENEGFLLVRRGVWAVPLADVDRQYVERFLVGINDIGRGAYDGRPHVYKTTSIRLGLGDLIPPILPFATKLGLLLRSPAEFQAAQRWQRQADATQPYWVIASQHGPVCSGIRIAVPVVADGLSALLMEIDSGDNVTAAVMRQFLSMIIDAGATDELLTAIKDDFNQIVALFAWTESLGLRSPLALASAEAARAAAYASDEFNFVLRTRGAFVNSIACT